MKLYANAYETEFFKTDNYLKNLHEIEITSIEEFCFKYSLNPLCLFDVKCLMVGEYDRLKSDNYHVDVFTSELIGEHVDIDFTKSMNYLDIFIEVCKYVEIDRYFLSELEDVLGIEYNEDTCVVRSKNSDDKRIVTVTNYDYDDEPTILEILR